MYQSTITKKSKTNLQPIVTIIEKLHALHSTKNEEKKEGKLTSRNSLARNNRKQQTKNKIKQLEDQICKLKQFKNNN